MSLTIPPSITDALEKYASQTGLTVNEFTLALGFGVAALAGFGAYMASGKKGSTPYGPGPKGVPILGNAADLPKTDDYKVYTQWAKKYGEHWSSINYFIYFIPAVSYSTCSPGDFIYLTVLGQPIYLISSLKAASELMDKRAMIYSDRPVMVMAQELFVSFLAISFTLIDCCFLQLWMGTYSRSYLLCGPTLHSIPQAVPHRPTQRACARARTIAGEIQSHNAQAHPRQAR
jgi:hypothetical protein